MSIQLLSDETINQIAAGEVIERPLSIVKELLENAIDAGAHAVSVEIRNGGLSMIRITDDGCGIEKDEVRLAFLRHATSKLREAADLSHIATLGFRGEALASIAAVAKVELITKRQDKLLAARYLIEGGEEKELSEIGAPDGTTIVVRELFYNVPARKKFLKSPSTEAARIQDILEKEALAHPEVAFRFLQDGRQKLMTLGNGSLMDVIYAIFGREIASQLITVKKSYLPSKLTGIPAVTIHGFLGKPTTNRSNRNFEIYFVNRRFVKNPLLQKAIEDGYRAFLMQHKFPFTVLLLDINPELVDVNVHPQKLEVRFSDGMTIYNCMVDALSRALHETELVVNLDLLSEDNAVDSAAGSAPHVEPFEHKREAVHAEAMKKSLSASLPAAARPKEDIVLGKPAAAKSEENILPEKPIATRPQADILPERVAADINTVNTDEKPSKPTPHVNASSRKEAPASGLSESTVSYAAKTAASVLLPPAASEDITPAKEPSAPAKGCTQEEEMTSAKNITPTAEAVTSSQKLSSDRGMPAEKPADTQKPEQESLFTEKFLSEKARKSHRIIGQLFNTYWLIEYDEKLYIIDQHAAHEKVNFERMMKRLKQKKPVSQYLNPPILLTLSADEALMLEKYQKYFEKLGYEINFLGGRDYSISAIPADLPEIDKKELLLEILDDLTDETGMTTADSIYDKLASMSCKAAVKGNNRLSVQEADALITELLQLDNPYACPHGRPTIISMSKQELEKKFKRIF